MLAWCQAAAVFRTVLLFFPFLLLFPLLPFLIVIVPLLLLVFLLVGILSHIGDGRFQTGNTAVLVFVLFVFVLVLFNWGRICVSVLFR